MFSLGLAEALRDAGVPVTFLAPADQLGSPRALEVGLPFEACTEQVLTRLADAGPTVFHSASLYEFPIEAPVLPRAVTDLRLPVTATLYDAIPYAEPDRYQPTPELQAFYAQRATLLRSCDHLLAISQFAADSTAALVGVAPGRVTTVGVGVGPHFVPSAPGIASSHPVAGAQPAKLVALGVTGPYAVCVAGNDPRKNVAGLARAWALLPDAVRRAHRLVIVGAIEERHRREWAGSLGGEVAFAGELSDAELVSVVQQARLSVFPSLNEGFGLPVAEAAACGVPAVCSDTTSMPEILAFPPATFDPTDPAAMAGVIVRGLTDEAFRAELLAAGAIAADRWRWSRVVERSVEVWSALVARPPRARPAGRPRVALVGPFGGSPSGIGTYNERLLPELDRRAEVTCFVEQFWGEAPLGTDGRRYPVAALGRHVPPTDFDHVVYTLGNSPFHLSSVRLLDHVGGHVWMHEAQLAELHIGTAHLLRDQVWAERFLDDAVTRDAGPAQLAALRADAGWDGMLDVDRYHELGVRLLSDVCARAESLIVSSEVAAGIVRAEPPGFGGDVLVLPIAYPSPTPAVAEAPPGHDTAVIGWLSPRKGLGQAIRVLSELRRTVPARLVFVGKALDGSLEALADALDAAGLPANSVEVTGYLSDLELRDRVVRCRAGLRLANRTDGEMSAAVTDLVASGVPTVTNLGSMGASSPGLQVIGDASDAQLVAALAPLLTDDHAYVAGSRDAHDRADRWGFPEVADRLLAWLSR